MTAKLLPGLFFDTQQNVLRKNRKQVLCTTDLTEDELDNVMNYFGLNSHYEMCVMFNWPLSPDVEETTLEYDEDCNKIQRLDDEVDYEESPLIASSEEMEMLEYMLDS